MALWPFTQAAPHICKYMENYKIVRQIAFRKCMNRVNCGTASPSNILNMNP